MSGALIFVIIVVILAWIYDFYNGANDCANSIATTVSSRVLSPTKAILLAAFLEFAGALVTTKVAETVGKGIVSENYMTPAIIISAITGAIVWTAFATHSGIPVSITHCLIGGMIGAGLTAHGLQAINWFKMKDVLIGMVTSPIAGFVGGLLIIALILKVFKNARPRFVNKFFGKAQIFSASFMAFTHGTNDAQNAMGIITAALLAGGFLTTFKVPLWVIIGSAFFMGLGTFIGGKKVIKTMGMKLTRIRPFHGFAAETSASLVILGASLLGIPISTTHTISTSIMGVGAVRRLSAVRWGIVGNIIVAWVITIPTAALAAGAIYWIVNFLFPA